MHKDAKRPDLTWRIANPSLAPSPENNNIEPHFNTIETR